MGRAKEWMMEQEERGWWSVPDKYVCTECFDDECLKQVIRENAEASSCDYCDLTSEELTGEENGLIAAPFDAVMEVIAEGLQFEWNSADDECITYESAEGGYQANTYDSYDLVWEYVCPNNEALAKEIIDSLPDHAWVERNYHSLSRDQALWYGWENFCKTVKHENRYMFQLRGRKQDQREPPVPQATLVEHVQPVEANSTSPDETVVRFGIRFQREMEIPDFREALAEAQEGVSASRMLDAIGESIEEVGLIRKLPPATKLFRGRVGHAKRPYKSARKLGPPPPKKAIANRMSPAGIPMFYGALDEHTAVGETVPGKLKRRECVYVGAFVTLEELTVVDLTNLQAVPSLFSNERYLRPILRFLHSFVRDLSKPIKKDGRVHIEYVPTQIVTEYFRHAFKPTDGQPIRGILYPSSRVAGGAACVLFFTREECGAQQRGAFKEDRKQGLRFIQGSANVFNRKPRKPSVL